MRDRAPRVRARRRAMLAPPTMHLRALLTAAVALAACGRDPGLPPAASPDVLDAAPSDASPDAVDAPTCTTDAGSNPAGPFGLEVHRWLPALGLATADGDVALDRYCAPCAASPRLLVIRTFAAWSGPSQ